MNERSLVLAAVVAFFLFGLVLPVIRLWRRERVFGVVLHRFLAAGMSFWLLAILAWGIAVALFEPAQLGIWPSPVWLRAIGWASVCGGLAVLMIAQAQMGASWRIGIDQRPTALVTGGLYAAVRNPIYSAMSLMLLGLCAVTPSLAILGAWLVTTIVAGVQTRREEQHLLALHGAQYRAYASKVGRFVPAVGRLS
jgi:protein-S-isoprenylcysteine O-methyltransferase Ste14